MGYKRTVSIEKRRFFCLLCNMEFNATFDHFGSQKRRCTRNSHFPLKNCLFLAYSTIAEM